ncbi:hypothetical protein DFJ73DRAFT_609422, partial [Zopfochytrium polystomum]
GGHLSQSQHAQLRLQAFRLKFRVPVSALEALQYVYPSDDVKSIQATLRRVSGYADEKYDCCIRICMCFSGENSNLKECLFCKHPRYDVNRRPFQQFRYLPLTTRLLGLFKNPETALKMRYRSEFKEENVGDISDVFSGTNYRKLCSTKVGIGSHTCSYNYFADPHDVALAFSLDGVSVFKKDRPT